MAKYDIYSKNGAKKLNEADEPILTEGITCTQEWMGESFVTAKIVSPYPIEWETGDYLIFQGDKYQIDTKPSVIKQKKAGIDADSFVYDNVRFAGYERELKDCEMRDVVLPTESNKHYTAMLEWGDFCNNVIDFAERILANLVRFYGNGVWSVQYEKDGSIYEVGTPGRPSDIEGSHDIDVRVSNESVFEALEHIYEDFALNYTIRGRKIIIASKGHNLSKALSYGKGNGLWKLEQVSDEQHKIITRLHAYGNETNMPIRYYNNLMTECFVREGEINKTIVREYKDRTEFVYNLKQWGASQGDAEIIWDEGMVSEKGQILYAFDIPFSGIRSSKYSGMSSSIAQIILDNGEKAVLLKGKHSVYHEDGTKEDKDVLIIATSNVSPWVRESYESSEKIMILRHCVHKDKWPTQYKRKTGESIPDNLNIKNLMLPGFGTSRSLHDIVFDIYEHEGNDRYSYVIGELSKLGFNSFSELSARFSFSRDPLDPWIQSSNGNEFGVKEGSVTFDGSVEDYDDIYPSIKYIGGGADTIVWCSDVEDNGVFDKKGENPTPFYIKVQLGFDPRQYLSFESNSFKIEMTTGYCGGRSFECNGVYDTDIDGKTNLERGYYRLKLQRCNDSSLSLYFPYDRCQIKAGDKFVITGIDMPDEYVELTAMNSLLLAAIKYLLDNDYAMYKYQLSVDEIQMQIWCDEADVNSVNIHDEIHAGLMLNFSDEDLAIDGGIAIDRLTIKEDEGVLPIYDITLSEDKQWSTLKRLKRQIKYQSFENSQVSGADGVNGSDGSFIKERIRLYALSETQDLPEMSEFSRGMKMPTKEKKYAWAYDEIVMNDGSIFGGYEEAYIFMTYSGFASDDIPNEVVTPENLADILAGLEGEIEIGGVVIGGGSISANDITLGKYNLPGGSIHIGRGQITKCDEMVCRPWESGKTEADKDDPDEPNDPDGDDEQMIWGESNWGESSWGIPGNGNNGQLIWGETNWGEGTWGRNPAVGSCSCYEISKSRLNNLLVSIFGKL